MSSLARRYLDLLEEAKATWQLLDESARAEELEAELKELWRDMSVEERLAVEKAVLE